MVEIFDDRVRITNLGGVPKGIDETNFGKLSIRRNTLIAELLQSIEYIAKSVVICWK